MVYLPFIVLVAQRYRKDAGIGTIISLMLPYTVILLVAWLLFFVAWYLLGIPIGPGLPGAAVGARRQGRDGQTSPARRAASTASARFDTASFR